MNDMTKLKPAELVAEYIELRDAKAKATDIFKTFCADNFDQRMEAIEGDLLRLFNELGVDNLSAHGVGTAYKKKSYSVTIADMREFRRHVIGSEDWDMADWRANKTMINDLVEAEKPLPPGVNYTSFSTIGIRRK